MSRDIKTSFESLGGFPASLEDVKERKSYLNNIIILHPKYQRVLTLLEDIHQLSKGSNQPDSLFLTGETGVGKTTILEVYRGMYKRTITDGITNVPILYNKVPVGATPKSLASSLLKSLGDPLYDKGTEISQTKRLLYHIEKCNVEMLIIDELQHLIDRETRHVLNKASDWMKSFCDDAGIPIILCGMPESQKIFEHNQQLDRRFPEKWVIYPFEYSSKVEQVEFITFIKNLSDRLPFSGDSNLAHKKIADKLFYISLGNVFYIKKHLEYATVIAARSGNDFIDENHLYEAFNRITISSRPDVVNPFNNREFNLIKAIELEKRKNRREDIL